MERHHAIVGTDLRPVSRIDIQADHRPRAAAPKATAVDGRIENEMRLAARIERKKLLDQFGIFFAVPD
jgi:hypothetical protein